MRLVSDASSTLGWKVDVAECARIWQGGCIIRASLLKSIYRAYKTNKVCVSIYCIWNVTQFAVFGVVLNLPRAQGSAESFAGPKHR